MSRFIRSRRALRDKVRSNAKLDGWLHLYATGVLVLNITLILYAMLSVTVRMTLAGLGLLDSLPIVLYILPLMIILPLMVRAYYRDRFAPVNFIILLIASGFFGVLSLLVHGFIIVLVLNAATLCIIFLMGRFRLKTSVRQIGRRTCITLIIINLIGLSFPVTTLALGQTSLATIEPSGELDLTLEVPLSDFTFPFSEIVPSSYLLQNLGESGVGLNLHHLEKNPDSVERLRLWLTEINQSSMSYTITMTSPRSSYFSGTIDSLGTNDILSRMYNDHLDSFLMLISDFELLNITKKPDFVFFDMTLSNEEWQLLMANTRSLNLPGFSSLIRASIDSFVTTSIESQASVLAFQAGLANLKCGVVVESFVLDDIQDFDTGSMKICGQTTATLSMWDAIQVDCSRSRFSYEMNGDVGEYLTHSYSRSAANQGTHWSLRMGAVGNESDVQSRVNTVYNSLNSIANDLVIAKGNGVNHITLESLPLLLSSFGPDAVNNLMASIDNVESVEVTYTFRIYAFRAVFIAIDSFDPIMI